MSCNAKWWRGLGAFAGVVIAASALISCGRSPSATVSAATPNSGAATVRFDSANQVSDSYNDGTPDLLRLSSESDRHMFRRWFAFLAEAQWFAPPAASAEINDCAALLRFAYREALRPHDATWAAKLALPITPGFTDVTQYSYPHTPLGAALFRVRSGRFAPADLRNGAFAEFADADTLRRWNAYFVSRDLHAAQRGDLLFFRQLDQRSPYHAMIYLGRSQIEQGPDSYVVYQTGPLGKTPGEIRRPSVRELLAHPEPRWRPIRENPGFLGVYRWTILRGAN